MIPTITSLEQRNQFDGSLIYTEGEFEQKTKRVDYQNIRKNDNKLWFINSANGCLESEHAETRVCPMCQNEHYSVVFNKDGFDHVRCEECSFLYVNPMLNEKALTTHYENEDRWAQVMLSEEEQKVNRIMYSHYLSYFDKIKENKTNSGLLLDVGSGSGFFLEVAAERGWQVKGIEYNIALIERSKSLGLDVVREDMQTLKNNGEQYDLITSWFVLEHVRHIDQFVAELASLVRDDGMVMIGVPNIDCLANRLYEKESGTFAGYSHVNFFNLHYLSKLFLKHGLSLVAAETHITQLNNIKKYFSRLTNFGTAGIPSIFETLTPEYIHEHFLGSNLVSVFRKV